MPFKRNMATYYRNVPQIFQLKTISLDHFSYLNPLNLNVWQINKIDFEI